MTELLRDLRFGGRFLRRAPGFAGGSIAVLAIGISLAATLFAVIKGALLDPWPYRGADRLVTVRGNYPAQGRSDFSLWSAKEVEDLRSASDVFEDVIAGDARNVNLTYGGRPERVRAALVTPNVFAMLGVPAALGRVANASDAAPGASRIVIVSDGFWRARLGADPSAIGRVLRLEGEPYEIAGVMPPSFRFWDRELWIPLRLDPSDARADRRWYVQATLRPGLTLPAAQARLDLLTKRMARDHPEIREYDRLTIALNFLLLDVLRGLAPTLYLLLAAVVLVLFVAAANLGNAMLARGMAREGEMAVRRALGGSVTQIARQLVVEAGLIGVAGGLAGAAAAAFLLPAVLAIIPYGYIPAEAHVAIDWRVVAAATLCGLACSILFGVVPAIRTARVDPGLLLKQSDTRTGSRRTSRWRSRLVVAQIGLAVVVIGVAAVAFLTLRGIVLRSPGFAADHVFTARVALPSADDARARADVFARLLLRVRSEAGVRGAALSSTLPIAPLPTTLVSTESASMADPADALDADIVAISPTFLNVLGIPTIAGRDFSDADTLDAPPVAIVSAALARRLWPGGSALGRRLTIGAPGSWTATTVVGVSGDIGADPTNPAVRPARFVPIAQRPPVVAAFAIASRDQRDMATAVERAVAAVDRDLPVFGQEMLADTRLDALGPERLAVVLLGAFGVAVLLLSAVGIYAVMNQSVRERERELAIRRAFGADARSLFEAELRRAGRMVLTGAVAGGLVASAALRWLASTFTVFGAGPAPGAIAGAITIVAALALAGAAVPAWRASANETIQR
jgi:predicted permease